jgi:hypothetical protein
MEISLAGTVQLGSGREAPVPIVGARQRRVGALRGSIRLARARDTIARDGHFISKAGKKRKRLGRPNADPKKVQAACRELANGTGVLKTAKLVGLGTGTVQRLKREISSRQPARSHT